MTNQEKIAKIQEQLKIKLANQANRAEELNIGKAEGIKRALGQGASYSFGDEIEAGIKSREKGTSYEDELKLSREKLEKFRKTNPVLAYGSEIAGFSKLAFCNLLVVREYIVSPTIRMSRIGESELVG